MNFGAQDIPILLGLFCRGCQIFSMRFILRLAYVHVFPLYMDYQKVVNFEVLFLLAQDWNFQPSELNHTKKRSNSAAVTSRVACFGEDVGFGRRSAVIYFYLYLSVCVGVELWLWTGGAPSDRAQLTFLIFGEGK